MENSILMTIKAPRGSCIIYGEGYLSLLQSGYRKKRGSYYHHLAKGYWSKRCNAIRAFMEEHKND